jgi:hypothetical protein
LLGSRVDHELQASVKFVLVIPAKANPTGFPLAAALAGMTQVPADPSIPRQPGFKETL